MHKLMALLAVPLKAIQCALGARHFDDHPYASRLQPLRRVPHMLWEQENFSLLDRNFEWRVTRSFHQPEKNVALQLIKEFFRRIVVIITTVIWPANHRHHHLPVFPNLRIAHGWFELFFVRLDPLLKIEGLQLLDRRHTGSYF